MYFQHNLKLYFDGINEIISKSSKIYRFFHFFLLGCKVIKLSIIAKTIIYWITKTFNFQNHVLFFFNLKIFCWCWLFGQNSLHLKNCFFLDPWNFERWFEGSWIFPGSAKAFASGFTWDADIIGNFSTSLLQITWVSSHTCNFTNKNISDIQKTLVRLLLRYISQKNFRGPQTPHFADINLSNFSSINWKTDLPKFLQIWYLGTMKLVGHKYQPYSSTCVKNAFLTMFWSLWCLD